MVGQPVDSKSTWSYQNYVWWKVESGARNEGKWLEVEADCWQKSGLEVPGLRGANPNSRKSKLWDGRKKGRSLQRSCVMWLKEGEIHLLHLQHHGELWGRESFRSAAATSSSKRDVPQVGELPCPGHAQRPGAWSLFVFQPAEKQIVGFEKDLIHC